MFGARISVRTLWKLRGEVSPTEMASTSVIFRVKQFKEDSVLNCVPKRRILLALLQDFTRNKNSSSLLLQSVDMAQLNSGSNCLHQEMEFCYHRLSALPYVLQSAVHCRSWMDM